MYKKILWLAALLGLMLSAAPAMVPLSAQAKTVARAKATIPQKSTVKSAAKSTAKKHHQRIQARTSIKQPKQAKEHIAANVGSAKISATITAAAKKQVSRNTPRRTGKVKVAQAHTKKHSSKASKLLTKVPTAPTHFAAGPIQKHKKLKNAPKKHKTHVLAKAKATAKTPKTPKSTGSSQKFSKKHGKPAKTHAKGKKAKRSKKVVQGKTTTVSGNTVQMPIQEPLAQDQLGQPDQIEPQDPDPSNVSAVSGPDQNGGVTRTDPANVNLASDPNQDSSNQDWSSLDNLIPDFLDMIAPAGQPATIDGMQNKALVQAVNAIADKTSPSVNNDNASVSDYAGPGDLPDSADVIDTSTNDPATDPVDGLEQGLSDQGKATTMAIAKLARLLTPIF